MGAVREEPRSAPPVDGSTTLPPHVVHTGEAIPATPERVDPPVPRAAEEDVEEIREPEPTPFVVGPPPSPPPPPAGTAANLVKASLPTCSFPPEAGKDIDVAKAVLIVSVDAAGVPVGARFLHDPGSGFGRAARDCLLRARYGPALDATGRAVPGDTPPISVRFSR